MMEKLKKMEKKNNAVFNIGNTIYIEKPMGNEESR